LLIDIIKQMLTNSQWIKYQFWYIQYSIMCTHVA